MPKPARITAYLSITPSGAAVNDLSISCSGRKKGEPPKRAIKELCDLAAGVGESLEAQWSREKSLFDIQTWPLPDSAIAEQIESFRRTRP